METGSFQAAPRGDLLLRIVNLFYNAIADLVSQLPAIGITDSTFVREGQIKLQAAGDFQSPLDPMAENILVLFLRTALQRDLPVCLPFPSGERRAATAVSQLHLASCC